MRNTISFDSSSLRHSAEQLIKNRLANTWQRLSETEVLELIHDLEIHQIELEIQNEELVQTRAVAQDSADKYTELYDSAPFGYFTLSKEGKILELNRKAANMLGNRRSQLINEQFESLVSEDSKSIYYNFFEEIFGNKISDNCEIKIKANGDYTDVHFSAVFVENAECCFATMLDISQRKQMEEALKASEQNLQKMNAEQNKYFSIIAHDLRSPFTSFLGLTKILTEELSDLSMDEIKEFAVSMRNSANNLYRLLENLLKWTQIQQGLIPCHHEAVLLYPIVDENIVMISEQANNKDIKIIDDVSDNLMVHTDSNILHTIIRNLISNAVKFTTKGGRVNISAKKNDNNFVEIVIRDNGIGMNHEMIDNLFKLDTKTNRKGTDDEPSTGLGLLLCKEFIEMLGGQIWVESEEFKGSAFYFTIPCAM